tara:strand:+ start:42 stop:344 length:303 start_codon:yes stop_codon:yes gene_type:complete
MILFWLLYFLVSIIISASLIKLFDSKTLRVLIFSASFSLMNTIWFRGPGEEILAPILSIFLLEQLILESHGLSRIIRPFLFVAISTAIVSFFFIKRKPKS